MKEVREFSTGWGNDYPKTWSNRIQEDLVGAAKGDLQIPLFRPFDFVEEPNKPVEFVRNEKTRISVEAALGEGKYFHRNCDFDEIFFQWSGETTIETELGVYNMKPAEILLIPAGISHRSTGTADNLRLVVKVRDPLNVLLTEKDHIGHTEYTNKRIGGPDWKIPAGAEKSNKGKVEERLLTWADKPGSLTVVQREYDRLVGVADEGGREIAKVRAFDTFSGVTGRSQKGPRPTHLRQRRVQDRGLQHRRRAIWIPSRQSQRRVPAAIHGRFDKPHGIRIEHSGARASLRSFRAESPTRSSDARASGASFSIARLPGRSKWTWPSRPTTRRSR